MLAGNYDLIGEQYIRLFDRPQFDLFFGQFNKAPTLEGIHTVRLKPKEVIGSLSSKRAELLGIKLSPRIFGL